MRTLALFIAAGSLATLSLGAAHADSRGHHGSGHWGGGHTHGGWHGGGGYYSGARHYPYWGASWRGYYPYYGYSFAGYYGYPYAYYTPYPVYVSPRYYAYAYDEPVYVERRVVEYVEPRRSGYYDERADASPRTARRAAAPAPSERYTLSAKELFEFDRAELRKPQPKLDEIAAALKANPQVGAVTITGHTDRLGSEAYNQKLSERRANAVKNYLVAQGVDPKRLEAVGMGEKQPVVECDDRNQAALIKCLEPNRRVEVERITIEVRAPQGQGRVAGERARPAPAVPSYR